MGIVLTNNAKFTPYTFEQMLKPLVMATQEYNVIEEGMAELGSKADLVRMYADEEPDSEWAKKYYEYADNLDKQVEELAKHGLNPASRQGLLNLKRAYSSSVSPIEEAVKARKEAYKYRDTVKAKDNTAEFKNDRLSLSDFMNGNVGDNTYVSGKDIMARVASKAQIEGTALYNQLLKENMTPTEAMALVLKWSKNPNNPIVQEELNNLGYDAFNELSKASILNSISTGMYNAASKIAEGEYMTAMQRESLRLQEEAADRALEQMNLSRLRIDAELAGKGMKIADDGKSVEYDLESPLVTLDPVTGKPTLRGKETIVFEDGTTLDRSGSKPILRDKNGNMISEYRGKKADQILSESQLESRLNSLPNIMWDFTGGDWNSPGYSDEFSTTDAEQIPISQLSAKALKKLESMLVAHNMTFNDVTVYKDTDWLSRNHYRVVKKGMDLNNMPIASPNTTPVQVSLPKPTSTSSTSTDSINVGNIILQ